MSKKRHTAEQIIGKLREAEVLLSQGQSVSETCKKIEISEQTYIHWRKEYGGLRLDQANSPRELKKNTAYEWSATRSLTFVSDFLVSKCKERVEHHFPNRSARILDIGCGSGHLASILSGMGHEVIGVDVSLVRINLARDTNPGIQFECISVYDDDINKLGESSFDCIVSFEVIEHLFDPGGLLSRSFILLKPKGCLILSTPYHGYLKNLAISAFNKWDRHFSPYWIGGHIKFFSKKTLRQMTESAGFKNIQIQRAGGYPGVWKSMVMTGRK